MANNIFFIVEIIIIGAVIVLQYINFNKTRLQINRTGRCIGAGSEYIIVKYKLPLEDAVKYTPHYIINQYEHKASKEHKGTLVEIALIKLKDANKYLPVFKNILKSINTYLLRNRGVPGFDIIKDIVERNVNSEEEQIQLSLSLPLYLGLLGAMGGIILALFKIVFSGGISEFSTHEIKFLLTGVGIAMIASAFGILFTSLNAWYLKKASAGLETCKNEFYNMVQTELLPQISTDLASSLVTLQRNLDSFNLKFESNLDRIEGMFGDNIKSLELQKEVLQKVEKTDLSQMIKVNTALFTGIEKNIGEFSKFGEYLENINSFIGNTEELNDRLTEMVIKIGEYDDFRDSIRENFATSKELYKYLTRNFKQIDTDNGRMKKAVGIVEDELIKTLNELKRHTSATMSNITSLTTKQEDQLINAFNDQVSTIKDVSTEQNHVLETHFSELRDKMTNSLSTENLTEIFGKLNKIIELLGGDVRNIQSMFEEQQNLTTEFTKTFSNDFSLYQEKIHGYMKQNIELLSSVKSSLPGKKVDMSKHRVENNKPITAEINYKAYKTIPKKPDEPKKKKITKWTKILWEVLFN